MKNAARTRTMQRPSAFFGGRGLAASHLEAWAKGAALWLLFLISVMQPLHLAQEVHALLPASAQHHAAIHCEEAREGLCEQPSDDLSKPLDGFQHERHHMAKCAADSHISLPGVDVVKGTPSQWDSFLLDCLLVAAAPRLEVPAFPKKSRAPPLVERTPQSPSHSFPSGRAPPLEA